MNPTIVRLAVQALLGRRRFVVLMLIPLVMLALTTVVRALAGEGAGYTEIVSGLGLGLVLPLVALLTTSSALGPEIDDGSIVYLLAKPVNRHVVAVSKYVVAVGATLLFGALPVLLAGLIDDWSRPDTAVAWLAGAVVASFAYCGLFLALASVTRHAVVVGLLVVFLWEGLLGGLLTGVRWLSVNAWAAEVAAAVGDRVSVSGAGVGTAYALIATLVVVVLGVWYAGERLRSFSLRGET